jgi:hypothetical protein
VREACRSVGLRVMPDPFNDTLIYALRNGDFSLKQNTRCDKYDVFSDASIAPWYKEFHEEFPDAKFLLTTRAIPAWVMSMLSKKQGLPYPTDNPGEFIHQWLMNDYITAESVSKIEDCYEAHNAAVRFYFRNNENFIEIDIPKVIAEEDDKAVWAKLTPFLGVTVKNRAFPHANRRRDS